MLYYSFRVPMAYLSDFADEQNFMFCYPNTLENKPTLNFYKTAGSQKQVILYSRHSESNIAINIHDLVDYAMEINAREIVAPYINYNHKKTYALAYDLLKYLERKNLSSKFEVIPVPQGNSVADIISCLEGMLHLPVKTVGIPAQLLRGDNSYLLEQTRFNIIKHIVTGRRSPKKSIHLIDLYGLQYLKAYKKVQRYFNIRSLNTDYPLLVGILGKTFSQTKKRPILNVREDTQLTTATIERIKNNIKFMREYK